MDESDAYLRSTGKEPPQAPDEYAWQWAYRGANLAEQQKLLEILQTEAEAEAEQMSLC